MPVDLDRLISGTTSRQLRNLGMWMVRYCPRYGVKAKYDNLNCCDIRHISPRDSGEDAA